MFHIYIYIYIPHNKLTSAPVAILAQGARGIIFIPNFKPHPIYLPKYLCI